MSQSTTPTRALLNRLRRPEYTGENRCIPCTAVNVAISVALGAALATVSIPLAGLALGASLALIYLRGYLVPYTPAITKRYLPDRVLRWFDKEPARRPVEDVEEIDVEQTLSDLGVLTECERVDDLCLDATFQRRWRDHVRELRKKETKTEDISELLELADDGESEIEEWGSEAAVVVIDGTQVGQWESDAALLGDLAADKALREWTDEWDRFHVVNRSQILNSLRMFIERCPECDAPVSLGQETVESCCRSYDVVSVSCEDCGSRLFEIEITDQLQEQL